MVDYAETVADFRLGRTLSRSFGTFFRNFIPFGLISLTVTSPTYLYSILFMSGSEFNPADPLGYFTEFWPQIVAIMVINFLLGYLVMAALTYGTIQDLKNDRAGIGDCFSKGLALMLPAIGVAIVTIIITFFAALVTVFPIMMVFGFLTAAVGESIFLTIVFGLLAAAPIAYLWTILWVIIPVAVIERRGIGSLARSAVLTKGSRWRIFFLMIIILAVAFGIGLLTGAVELVASEILVTEPGEVSSAAHTVQVATEWILSAIISAFSAVLVAVSYHDLRVAKEGADTSQIASVFD